MQQKFRLPVCFFVAGLGGVGAAMVFQVQLAVPDGQLAVQLRLHLAEKVDHLAAPHLGHSGKMANFANSPISWWAAAAVAVTVRHQQMAGGLFLLKGAPAFQNLAGVAAAL
ncbi:MAG: hypothetical protein R3D55_06385 [Chloroflexota bacterium]